MNKTTDSKDLKLTPTMVFCANCKKCYWNDVRLLLPNVKDDYCCRSCFTDRLNKKEEIYVDRSAAIQACIRYYEGKHTQLYRDVYTAEYTKWCYDKMRVFQSMQAKIREIMQSDDIEFLTNEKRRYDQLYFGKEIS